MTTSISIFKTILMISIIHSSQCEFDFFNLNKSQKSYTVRDFSPTKNKSSCLFDDVPTDAKLLYGTSFQKSAERQTKQLRPKTEHNLKIGKISSRSHVK